MGACIVNADTLPLWANNLSVPDRSSPTRYLFLLGHAYSGTSATHFLLSTSSNVATIKNDNSLGPGKEGWAVAGMQWWFLGKGPGTAVPWERLNQTYHKHWNLTKPILLENSPPEILHSRELEDFFGKYGKVRFVLLVRSPCTFTSLRGNIKTWVYYARVWEPVLSSHRKEDV